MLSIFFIIVCFLLPIFTKTDGKPSFPILHTPSGAGKYASMLASVLIIPMVILNTMAFLGNFNSIVIHSITIMVIVFLRECVENF